MNAESADQSRALWARGAAGLLVLVAVVALWRSFRPAPSSAAAFSGQAFYTVDDGKTYFADDISKGYSFDRNGQLAVRALVYSCDGGRTPFVAFMRRTAAGGAKTDPHSPGPSINSLQVKKPGGANWVPMLSREGAMVQQVHCPGGSGTAMPVEP